MTFKPLPLHRRRAHDGSMTKRALIVIDVQNDYFTGDLQVTYPDPADSLANVVRAMDAATAAGIPVIVVQQDVPEGAPIFAVGTPGWELHDEVASRPHDLLLHKQRPGAFTGTDLEAWLRNHDIDTLAVVGYMTNMCVDTTVRQASHLGLQVELLGDATGTLDYSNTAGTVTAEQIHHVTLTVLHSALAAVGSTDSWIAALGGDVLVPGDLYSSTRRRVDA